MNKRKGFTKSIAFTLVMAMLFATLSFGGMAGLPGVGGVEAYGAESITATVRIEGPDGVTILPVTEGAIVDGVTTIGGFVAEICSDAGIDFQLNGGYPATVGAINGMWMTRINDSGDIFSAGNGTWLDFTDKTLKNGDQIVIYLWQNGVSYSSFELSNPTKKQVGDYYQGSIPITLYKYSGNPEEKLAVSNTTITAISREYPEYPTRVMTDENGQAILNLWSGTYDISVELFLLSSESITKPYACVVVDGQGNTTVESPNMPEVGIVKLDIEIGDGYVYDIKSRLELGNPYFSTTSTMTGITVTAIPISEEAEISISPGGVLASGTSFYISDSTLLESNPFILLVTNGLFSKEYKFFVNTVPPSLDSSEFQIVIDEVKSAALTKGIGYYDDYYNEYLIALYSSGGQLTETEKDIYYSRVMSTVDSSKGISASRLAKEAASLGVMGIDPRQVPDISATVPLGTTIDLIDKISDSQLTNYDNYRAPYILLAYDSGNYPTTGELTRSKVIDYLLSQQDVSGGFPKNSPDTDTTALYLMAMSPYYKASSGLNGVDAFRINKVKESVTKGLYYLKQQQKNYGRFIGWNYESSNSTAMVVSALTSLGIDPQGAEFTKDGYGALQGLLSYVTADNLIGVTDAISSNYVSNVQGVMALIAYEKFSQNSNANLYMVSTELRIFDGWPTEILKRIEVERTNFEYKAGEVIKPEYLTVTAIFSSQGGIRSDVITNNPDGISGYKITGGNPLTSGGNNITISYRGKNLVYIQNALNADGTAPQIKTVALTVKDENNRTIASQGNAPIQPGVTSVIDALIMTLNEANVPYTIPGGTYVSSINGLGEFDLGPYSGWLYQVNGNTPSTTGADQYKLTGGERVTWYYTKDFTKDASSSAWVTENQAGAVQNGLVSVTTDVKAVTGSDGTAKATVSTTQLDTAVSDALKAAAASKDGAKPAVTIAIEADSKAQGVETVIPKAAFANLVNKGIQQMTIASPLGNITLDLETLKDIVKGGAGDISLSIKKAEESQGRPVIRLEINNGGKAVGTFSKPITITVPYNPAASENEQGIAVFHLDENGQWKNIKASKYDGKNKAIVFRTNHFSDFVIAYSHKTFGDIQGHWAQTPIEYLASRRIIQGMTEESFAPNGTITRAQFVTLLAGMAGADLNQYSLSRFNDVKDNAWYKGAVVWAAENGIVQGLQAADGSFWFNPNQNISRQDMAVVMMRYLAWAKEPAKETTKAIAFKDGSAIASYAKESVATMQKAGLINGRTTPDNQTVFDPAGKLTRAEAAQILTNQLYQQF